MASQIEFYKSYSRESRSPWSDKARYCLLFLPESKHGIYLHVGDSGFNGMSVSRELQKRLPRQLQQQYINLDHIDVVMHVFEKELAKYCQTEIDQQAFKNAFLVSPIVFFSETAQVQRKQSYDNYLASLNN
jgi:hypothetical protein